jgi:hypothetical protein
MARVELLCKHIYNDIPELESKYNVALSVLKKRYTAIGTGQLSHWCKIVEIDESDIANILNGTMKLPVHHMALAIAKSSGFVTYDKKCTYCGNQFVTEKKNRKCCSEKCTVEHKKTHPTKEELAELIGKSTYKEIAKRYKVSEPMVHYWARRHKLL